MILRERTSLRDLLWIATLYSESDMLGLRKRIKELEDEVKETHVSKTLLE